MAKIDPNNRNAHLDEGLGARMFSGIVTGSQNYQESQRRVAEQLAEILAETDPE